MIVVAEREEIGVVDAPGCGSVEGIGAREESGVVDTSGCGFVVAGIAESGVGDATGC